MRHEPVFLVSEFSLKYILILEGQILVLDIRRKFLRCTSEMIMSPKNNAQYRLEQNLACLASAEWRLCIQNEQAKAIVK